ncbi:adenine deaminase C-terminal domain-containing protein [Chloroflexota bacterium]
MKVGNPSKLSEKGLNQVDTEKIKILIDTALGKTKADIVVANADLVNVYSGELLRGQSVAIKEDRIAYVGENAEHTTGPDTQVINATGKILIPGLIDAHNHIISYEDVDEFLKCAITGGTTTIVSETINLVLPLGYRGVQQFLKATGNQPIKIFTTVAPVLSLSPASKLNGIRPKELRRLLRQKRVVGLGESNWTFILQDEGGILELHAETLNVGKHLEGHSAGASGNNLVAYVASGISSCHESTTAEEALERLRLGLYVMIREGDVRRELEAIARIKDEPIDFRRLVLCIDWVRSNHLMKHGYMEFVVQKAIDLGFDPIVAIQMATINSATLLSLDNFIGGIAPGRCADMVIIPDLRNIKAEMVISNGQIIARGGQILVSPRKHNYPKSTLRSVHIPGNLEPADFQVHVQETDTQLTVRVINQVTSLLTKEGQIAMIPEDGLLKADVERDILKVSFIDRTNNPGKMFTGFAKGFGLRTGAFASSVSMGLSGITVVGATEEDMAGAVNRVIALQGGFAVYSEGRVLVELPLPIAGFASSLPIETIVQIFEEIQQIVTNLGTSLQSFYQAVVSLTSPVIPFLRICEAGLMDTKKGKLVDLIVQ